MRRSAKALIMLDSMAAWSGPGFVGDLPTRPSTAGSPGSPGAKGRRKARKAQKKARRNSRK